MANSKEVFKDLVAKMRLNDSPSEIEAIAYFILERAAGITRMDVMKGKELSAAPDFTEVIERLHRQEPIQYIVGEEIFDGRVFEVNPSVLIPRPETELLLPEVVQLLNGQESIRILDVGTGSGCLAVSLALRCSAAEFFATDVSEGALRTAQRNAARHGVNITFSKSDILRQDLPVGDLTIVVSNPPYIPQREEQQMQTRVTQYEPHLALFVPDHDPLIFYRAISRKAKNALRPGGWLLFEIHESFGREIVAVMEAAGFRSVTIKKDLDSKDRMVVGQA